MRIPPSACGVTVSFAGLFSSRATWPTRHLFLVSAPLIFQPVRSLPLNSTLGLPASAARIKDTEADAPSSATMTSKRTMAISFKDVGEPKNVGQPFQADA